MSLIERALIGRSPIEGVLIELFSFEKEKHAPRPAHTLRPEADRNQEDQRLVAGTLGAGKRSGAQLSRRRRARTTQHRAAQHLQAGGSAGRGAFRSTGNSCRGTGTGTVARYVIVALCRLVVYGRVAKSK